MLTVFVGMEIIPVHFLCCLLRFVQRRTPGPGEYQFETGIGEFQLRNFLNKLLNLVVIGYH
jgi:hypothetical protein